MAYFSIDKNKQVCNFYLDRSYVDRTELAQVMKGCQFEALGDEYQEAVYCVFHLPMAFKKSWTPKDIAKFNRGIHEYIEESVRQGKLIDLSGAVFPSDFRIEPAENERKLELPRILFLHCIFMGDFEAKNIIFSDMAAWNDSLFLEQCLFTNVVFNGEANFDAATMLMASFSACKFYDHAYFQGAIFQGGSSFTSCFFRGRAWYQNARFFGCDYFIKCEFHGEADFETIPSAKESDKDAETFAQITFKDSQFYSRANFTNRRFLAKADFSGVTFHTAPEFYGCSLHQDTNFSTTTFLDKGK